jgi:DNA (cytosine-5)-methyltransferase 1
VKALDLFCKAGGATRGLQLAGFHVTGVDIEPQPRYCGDAFIQADALSVDLSGYDLIWASPPCQGYSRLRHLPWLKDREYPLLIDPVRERLQASGAAWVMENVEDAPLRNDVTLCGLMFGLPTYRHRKFECSFPLLAPMHERHREVIGSGRMVNDRRKGTLNAGSGAGAWGKSRMVTVAGGQFLKADGERALGIDWMSKVELAQAIPPAYARWLGEQALAHIRATRVAA